MEIAHDLRLALDPVAFALDLGFIPDPWQERVLRWTGKRLLMNCSRQSGKSTTAAILGLHRALYYPKSLILLVSPSLRQSSELFRKVTEFLGNLSMRTELMEDNRLSCTLQNKSRIVSLPSSENTIRGFSNVSLVIEDESARVSDDLYRTIRPMLAVSKGRLILMSTPFGKRGHFFEEWTNGDGWERVRVPATECPRISPEFLEQERGSLGEWWFNQEYMCEFMETLDNLFGYDLINKAVSSDIKPLFGG
ncbi:MAG: terminase large subunit domain-containing protein [Ignavibacteriales bacterium]